YNEDEVKANFERAKSEARAAFGREDVYVERFLENPKHIEVQILGDSHGNIVHLFERDCSIQRRHQKVIEIAPSVTMSEELREEICQAAVDLASHVKYLNAGTVEFLIEGIEFYFIEVKSNIKIEYTITVKINN